VRIPGRIGLALILLVWESAASAQCKLTESKRKFEGAERTIVTMENQRIIVEVVPELEGRIIRYRDKGRPASAFEWLDDCPYHFGARWEGKPFEYRIDARGPDRAALSVTGGGKIAVTLLRAVTGIATTSPVELRVERTMSIEAGTTRLRIDLKVANVGESVAPMFRYMVHAVYGQVPPMPGGRALWFLPTTSGVEFFDGARGRREMGASAGSGGAPLDHPFSRFTPGVKADKPRYEAGGWGAVLTSAGPTYICYAPEQYDFMQYWFGGDAEWHFTFEPHTKPVDLKPGQSNSFSFTLAYDAKDVPFKTTTVAYERPVVPTELAPGTSFTIKARATTVRHKKEQAKVSIGVKDPKGNAIVSRDVVGEVKPFSFSDFGAECKIAHNATLGKYTWMARAGGRELASGKIDVVSAAQLQKLRMERATAALKKKYEDTIRKQRQEIEESRQLSRLWREGVNLALTLNDRSVWPAGPPPTSVAVTYKRGAVPVLGLWKEKELPRIKALAPAPLTAWPDNPEGLLAALKGDRANVRDVAPDATGKGLVVLLVDPAKKRAEVVRLSEGRIVRRFGRFSERPGERDDTLGAVARAIAVDRQGNIWVATNAWGQTSVFRRGADGAPYEASVTGNKGALKKFSPEGRCLGAVSLLEAPMDLALGEADGTPVALVSYRSVSEYHGAQVREGIVVVRVSDATRIGEIKTSAGSLCIDESGRLWIADVAGHIGCYDLRGRKQFDVANSPAPAAPDARLPANSPLPVVVRSDGKGTVWALFTLARKLIALDPKGAKRGEARPAPKTAGGLYRLALTPAGPVGIADQALWRP